MAIPVEHKIVVRPVDNDAYPFLVTCSCFWQAHSRSREDALAHARNHGGRQAYAGNPVTIDVSAVPPPEPPPNQTPVEVPVVEPPVPEGGPYPDPFGVTNEPVSGPEGSVEAVGAEPAPEPVTSPTPEAESGS